MMAYVMGQFIFVGVWPQKVHKEYDIWARF